MANRHLARTMVLQSLFEADFRGSSENVDDVLARNIAEHGSKLGKEDTHFIRSLAEGVLKKQATLDTIIEKAAHDWPIEQTPLVDRNVLRIGLFELLFSPKEEVPARVAINEAIELGKSFGGERSGKFVNGVLGTIYKEMGEPGKDDAPKKKKNKNDLTPAEREKLPVDRKSGAVVFAKKDGELILGFVHDIFGYWTLTKGTVEEGESDEVAAVREAKEEMNLDVAIIAKLGTNEYIANDPERGHVRKQVNYFLAEASEATALSLGRTGGGLDDARWFSKKEAEELRMYDDIRPIVEKGIALIK